MRPSAGLATDSQSSGLSQRARPVSMAVRLLGFPHPLAPWANEPQELGPTACPDGWLVTDWSRGKLETGRYRASRGGHRQRHRPCSDGME